MAKNKNKINYEKCRQEVAKQYNTRIKELEEDNKSLRISNYELRCEIDKLKRELSQLEEDINILDISNKHTKSYGAPLNDIMNKIGISGSFIQSFGNF